MVGFKCFCGFPFVHGVIDVTQIHIQEHKRTFVVFFFSSPSHITCNYKLLLTTKRSLEIFLWGCSAP